LLAVAQVSRQAHLLAKAVRTLDAGTDRISSRGGTAAVRTVLHVRTHCTLFSLIEYYYFSTKITVAKENRGLDKNIAQQR